MDRFIKDNKESAVTANCTYFVMRHNNEHITFQLSDQLK